MRVLGLVLLVVVLLAATYLGYLAYLTSTIPQPYDEVWIGLNSPLPAPLRAWSCGALHDRLGAGAGIAPSGCEGLWD